MITIRKSYGEGGAGLGSTPTALHRPIAEVLRGLIDDIAAAGGAAATIVSPDASDLATAITLVNEIKGALNAVPAAGAATVVKG